MRAFILALLIFYAGCAAIATKEAAIGCQAADIATTYRALHLNHLAYETNPVPLPLLLLLKLGLIWYIWQSEDWNTDEESKNTRALVTVIGCAPVPGNLKAAKG